MSIDDTMLRQYGGEPQHETEFSEPTHSINSNDIVDWNTFSQILGMDEDPDDHDFSKMIIEEYYEQADSTFLQMDHALESRDLSLLSSLGHFLKGSSASLGLSKVQLSCEKIQHFGAHKDETGVVSIPDDEQCLDNVRTTLNQAKSDYNEAKAWLSKFFAK